MMAPPHRMSDSTDSYTQHCPLFVRVYDLDDPSPYFAALRPSGYRMPAALVSALEAIHAPLGAACGAGDTPRVLDFAGGELVTDNYLSPAR